MQLLEQITSDQQDILRKVLGTDELDNVPQMWAMYKEVMGFFANGVGLTSCCRLRLTISLKCQKMVLLDPHHTLTSVTPLLADDNWGNLMAVMPDKTHQAGGGIYYHADCGIYENSKS